ncbi:MAG: hypothetical protein C4329_00650 [Chitinophagaceae bacterium]
MSKKLQSYDDLLEERARLEELLKTRKALVQSNFIVLKDTLRPVGNAASNVMSLLGTVGTKRKNSPLVNLGIDLGTEVVLKRMLLARKGWFLRVVVPFIVKNYSSHLFAQKEQNSMWRTIRKMFTKAKEKAQ